MSPVESKQLARLEGVRELLARSEDAVFFGDGVGRDELRRDDAQRKPSTRSQSAPSSRVAASNGVRRLPLSFDRRSTVALVHPRIYRGCNRLLN